MWCDIDAAIRGNSPSKAHADDLATKSIGDGGVSLAVIPDIIVS
jgi:hypothetical protein